MSLLSIYSGSACAWIISEINRDTMGELQVVIPKAASTLLYPMVRPLTVRLGSLLLRIYSAFSFVLFSALYFLKTANIQELNVLLFAEYLLLCGRIEFMGSSWRARKKNLASLDCNYTCQRDSIRNVFGSLRFLLM